MARARVVLVGESAFGALAPPLGVRVEFCELTAEIAGRGDLHGVPIFEFDAGTVRASLALALEIAVPAVLVNVRDGSVKVVAVFTELAHSNVEAGAGDLTCDHTLFEAGLCLRSVALGFVLAEHPLGDK